MTSARFCVRLTPRGGVDRIDGVEADGQGRPRVKARVSSAPTDGAANAALIKLLSKHLNISASRILLLRGQTARIKEIEISGEDLGAVLAKLSQTSR